MASHRCLPRSDVTCRCYRWRSFVGHISWRELEGWWRWGELETDDSLSPAPSIRFSIIHLDHSCYLLSLAYHILLPFSWPCIQYVWGAICRPRSKMHNEYAPKMLRNYAKMEDMSMAKRMPTRIGLTSITNDTRTNIGRRFRLDLGMHLTIVYDMNMNNTMQERHGDWFQNV